MPSIAPFLSRIFPCFKHSSPPAAPRPLRGPIDGTLTLTDLIARLQVEWPAADGAANARVRALSLGTAMPVATRRLLHAMYLHLALQATLRRSGSGSGPPPPDLRRAIARAATALTRTERKALLPHLAETRGWLAWSRAQLLRPHERVARHQGVLVETDTERLLHSVREALRSSIPPSTVGTSARAADHDDSKRVDQALRSAAAEIRTPGHWYGLGADLAPLLITSMPGWPKDLSLRIEDRAGKWTPLEFGPLAKGRTPVTLQLDHARQHYSPVVDGRLRTVSAKGDCFYESVLRAMRVEDQRTLFKGIRFRPGAGMADLIQVLRHRVADELDRLRRRPGGPPDTVRAAAQARQAPAGRRA